MLEKTLAGILEAQVRRYPLLEIQDLYKLLHQASLGSEHAVSNDDGVRAWLDGELATMGAGPEEPLLDDISPDGEIVRVHLRPYLGAGHEPERLLEAFLRTAREYQGSVERFGRYGEVAVQVASAGRLNVPAEQISQFMQQMGEQGFPAIHHSAPFRAHYRPAYRVVARVFLEPAIATR
jgi:hypothetical protein